jgi:hypothetical protein
MTNSKLPTGRPWRWEEMSTQALGDTPVTTGWNPGFWTCMRSQLQGLLGKHLGSLGESFPAIKHQELWPVYFPSWSISRTSHLFELDSRKQLTHGYFSASLPCGVTCMAPLFQPHIWLPCQQRNEVSDHSQNMTVGIPFMKMEWGQW